ncbi:MAG: DUF4260 domain-containing protein [Leadbetterella sp.]
MKFTLRTEQIGILLLAIMNFKLLSFSWWWFAGLFFAPDLSIAAYWINNKVGAWVYNIFHHQGIACVLLIIGMITWYNPISLVGSILLVHSAFDRALGLGLKYSTGFKHTHLGDI